MTKRDYILLAAALRNAKPAYERGHDAHLAWMASCCAVCDVLGRSNARFDTDRFLTACGIEFGEEIQS